MKSLAYFKNKRHSRVPARNASQSDAGGGGL
jgi:hypothetical protein